MSRDSLRDPIYVSNIFVSNRRFRFVERRFSFSDRTLVRVVAKRRTRPQIKFFRIVVRFRNRIPDRCASESIFRTNRNSRLVRSSSPSSNSRFVEIFLEHPFVSRSSFVRVFSSRIRLSKIVRFFFFLFVVESNFRAFALVERIRFRRFARSFPFESFSIFASNDESFVERAAPRRIVEKPSSSKIPSSSFLSKSVRFFVRTFRTNLRLVSFRKSSKHS